jgi:hypothetical protein
MPTFTEPFRPYEVLLSEAPGTLSRESVTIASGAGALTAGTVLGKITKGAATAAHVAGGTGNSTFSAVTVGADSKVGVYQLIWTAATKVNVEDPDGVLLGVATLGSAFSGGGLTFTITAGGTPHVATDRATITVAAGSGNYASYDNTAANGTEVAAAVLLQAVDATSASVAAVAIVRLGEVKDEALQWHANNNAGAKTAGKADLALANIIAR